MHRHTRLLAALGTATLVLSTAIAAPSVAGGRHHHHPPRPVVETVTALDGPRGLDALGDGRAIVSESDGSFSLVVERRRGPAVVIPLGSVDPGFAPAVAAGKRGTVYVLTGAAGEPGAPRVEGSSTLYKWKKGYDAPVPVANIAAYQATNPDEADLEGVPADSNPFGLAVLPSGKVLVADAAGNDLLKVNPRTGSIRTVARLLPRTVEVPDGLPPTDPGGEPLPPAGTEIPSEAVATSIAVGPDGAMYVGELRGFPATPGTSQIWRIEPGARDAVCDPEAPDEGDCQLFSDGLTSIVDLDVDRRGTVYALSLSTLSWLALELGVEGAEVGALWALTPDRHGWHGSHARGKGHWHDDDDDVRMTEIAPGELITPGGVDVVDRTAYVTGPVFGPGSLSKIRLRSHHRW